MSLFDEPSKEEITAEEAQRQHQQETWHRIGYGVGKVIAMILVAFGKMGADLNVYLEKHKPPKKVK